MALITANSKQAFIEQLQVRLQDLVLRGDHSAVAQFCSQFFGIATLAELEVRQDADLLGCTLSAWRFVQQMPGGDVKLRVFNPTPSSMAGKAPTALSRCCIVISRFWSIRCAWS
ncbi:hypothetical protein ULF88_21150 [Halopseudomonas pachastrellae]|nr:hypothetical protein [Halopseudomonas pachastrellae]